MSVERLHGGRKPTRGEADVILFGLSMDHHVFILSRVKELVDRGRRPGWQSSEGNLSGSLPVLGWPSALARHQQTLASWPATAEDALPGGCLRTLPDTELPVMPWQT